MGFAEGLRAGAEFGSSVVENFESTRKLYEQRERRKQAEQVGAALQAEMKEFSNQQALKQAEMREYERRSKLGEVDEREGQRLVLEFIDMENERFSTMNQKIMELAAAHGTNEFLQPTLQGLFESNVAQHQGVQDGLGKALQAQLETAAQEGQQARFEGTVAHETEMQATEGKQKLEQIDRAGMWDLRSQQAAAAGRSTGAQGPKPINPLDVDAQVLENVQSIYGEAWVSMKPEERRKAIADERRRIVEEARRVGSEFDLQEPEPEQKPEQADAEGGFKPSPALTRLQEQEKALQTEVQSIRDILAAAKSERAELGKQGRANLAAYGQLFEHPAVASRTRAEQKELESEREALKAAREPLESTISESESLLEQTEGELKSLRKMKDARQRQEQLATVNQRLSALRARVEGITGAGE
jgi:hypothetical protein